MAMKIQFVVLWIATPCSDVGILPHHYMALQSRIPWLNLTYPVLGFSEDKMQKQEVSSIHTSNVLQIIVIKRRKTHSSRPACCSLWKL